MKNNFIKVLEKTRSENRAALFAFITGYDPDYQTSKLIVKEIAKYADAIEIGNPFNTSTADSSVIMNASETAISAGATTQKILDLVKEIKLENIKLPIAIMGYLNSIHGYSINKYVKECKKSMVDACIVVDSSLDCPEDQELFEKLKREEISFIKLVTPTNDENYVKKCLKKTTSWIYVVSYAGVTGIKKYNIDYIKNSISQIRKHSKSVFIGCGFGIKTVSDVAEVAKYSDAVICGTAIVDLIAKESQKGAVGHDLALKVGEYVKELSKGLKR